MKRQTNSGDSDSAELAATAVTAGQLRAVLVALRSGFATELGALGPDLDRVSTLISEATSGLARAFMSLQEQAQLQGSLLETLLSAMDQNSGKGGRGIQEVVASASSALRHLATLLKDIVASSASGLARAQTMEGQMATTLKLLLGINTMARQTHVLSINATIEAVRVGQAGRGFEVVAREVRDLAGYSKKLAADIEAQIGHTQEALAAVRGSLKTVSANGAEATSATEGQAAKALGEMDGLRDQMMTGLSKIEAVNQEIARAVSDAVRCLQFGDVVGQIVGNMRARVDRLSSSLQVLDGAIAADRAPELDKCLRTLREIFAEELKSPVAAASMSQGDVELF